MHFTATEMVGSQNRDGSKFFNVLLRLSKNGAKIWHKIRPVRAANRWQILLLKSIGRLMVSKIVLRFFGRRVDG